VGRGRACSSSVSEGLARRKGVGRTVVGSGDPGEIDRVVVSQKSPEPDLILFRTSRKTDSVISKRSAGTRGVIAGGGGQVTSTTAGRQVIFAGGGQVIFAGGGQVRLITGLVQLTTG